VIEDRTELRFRPLSLFFHRLECGSTFLRVCDHFGLQTLRDSLKVCNARALGRERLLGARRYRSLVANQAICAFLEGVVCEVTLPLDDRSCGFGLCGSRRKSFLKGGIRCLRECDDR